MPGFGLRCVSQGRKGFFGPEEAVSWVVWRHLMPCFSQLLLAFTVLLFAACGPGGTDPVMQPVADQVVAVNQELLIDLIASDADGDEIFYTFESNVSEIHSRASLSRLPGGGGQFRWTPEARDVGEWFFDFRASDGSRSDTITLRIEVRAALGGDASPRFVHPQGSGTTLDLAVAQCLALNVEVVDSDSTEVALAQGVPLIEGALLDVVAKKSAIWNWCPSQAQIEAEQRYDLLLTADDGENPPRLHPYLIVLRSPLKPNCPGEPPAIVHTAMDVSSLVGLSIEAQITDDQGLKQEPLLYYSDVPPAAPPDFGQMIQVTMQQGVGDTWTAQLPNPVAGQPQGTSADLYYLIVADDDDDAEGNCDHRAQAPVSGFFSMTVTNPGGAGGAELCEACTADVQCGGALDHCVAIGSASALVCLADCGSSCPMDYECSTGSLSSVDGASSPQCVPLSLDCSDPGGGVCVDDAFENNDSRAEALANPVLAANTTHSLVSCPSQAGAGDDEDWFAVVIAQEGTLDIDVAFDGMVSDIDVAVYNEDGEFVASSSGFGSSEQLRLCVAQGTYLVRVYAFSSQQNPYTLRYSTSAQSCQSMTCMADDLEEDDNAAQATVVDLSMGVFTRAQRTLCEADEDWYQVELGNDELLAVDLTFEQAPNGDLDIHLVNQALVDLTPCSPSEVASCDTSNGQSGTANESAIYEAPATGCPCTYYVVVKGFDVDDENSYDIRIEGSN